MQLADPYPVVILVIGGFLGFISHTEIIMRIPRVPDDEMQIQVEPAKYGV